MPEPKRPYLSLRNKLFYGLGDIGFSLTSTLINVYYLLFLTDVVGLRPALAGTAIMIAKQWDWINDPLIGHLSDRTSSRWGRRRPFLLFGFIPFGVTFTLLWWKPFFQSQIGLAAFYVGAYILYDTAATFVYMPYFALTPELTPDYDERTTLTTYRMAFSILGSLIAFTLPWLIVGSFRPENSSRIWWNGVVFAVASAIPLLLTFLGTRERHDPSTLASPSLKESVKAILGNRPFLLSIGLFLLTWLAMSVIQAILLYFIKYWLQLENQTDIIFAVIFVTALLVLPLWEWISRHSNKRLAYIGGIAFWCLVQIALILTNSTTRPVIIFALAAMAGVGVSAAHVLPWAIIPDAIEWDELQTGQRHEGIFYSLLTLMQKAASGLALFFLGTALEWAGYVPNASAQSKRALTTIRAFTGSVPALLLCGGIALAIAYPISREDHLAVRRTLAQRRLARQRD
ncbi:MAG: MFS transporter [Anaerolineales bacterium]